MNKLDTWTDEQLVARYQETGCQDSFSILYKRYQRLIECISRKQARAVGVDVNEFVSALNMAFWRCVRRFDAARGSFKPYVQTALGYKAIDLYRAERNRRADDVDNYAISVEENEYRRVELRLDIMDAIKTDKLTRHVVKRCLVGYSISEVARELGVHHWTLCRRLRQYAEEVKAV
jgi:RNA polymerase sigma factor (sigma-70 family)